MGIDCSTHTLAFAIFDDGKPVRCGELKFEGSNLYERLHDAHNKIPQLVKAGILQADYVCFEGAIQVGNNVGTGISLAYMYGVCMGALIHGGMEVVNVGPITWQTYIGNPNLKAAEKAAIRAANPGKSDNWYRNAGREFRKQRTLKFAKQYFDIHTNSDNVGDAVGIAYYAVKTVG
jgi:hypothetical protein